MLLKLNNIYFLKLDRTYTIEFKSITAHIQLYAIIMNMEDKLNIHQLKSMPNMKGPENTGEIHTVI